MNKRNIRIAVGLCIALYVSYRIYRHIKLDKGLKQLILNGALILDVRTKQEFKTGHIEGAINIPLNRIRTNHIPLDKNKRYITVCSHGIRSIKAMNLLKKRGYKEVFNGGAWSELEEAIH